MSDVTLQVVECVGDPRAMGHAQGVALRSEIRDRVAHAGRARRGRSPFSLRPLVAGPVVGGGMGREIVRHYAHLSERIQGLASGARLSIDSVMELFVRAARDELAGDPLFAAGLPLARSTEAGDTKLARTLAVAASSGSTWIARRSAPEVGFASIELTLPWLATAIAGVNEAGVAAVFAPRPPGGHSECTRSSAPSPILLVQECLQRFDSIEGCLDWASKRPVAGNACLLVSDAAGGAAAVEIEGEERRVTQKLDPSDPSSGLGPASSMEEPDGATLLVVARPAERLLQVRLPGAGAPVALGVHA